MTVKKKRGEESGVFFCTFTCFQWIPLFEITELYDHLYNWFSILIEKKNQILGFVIMPNHIHFLIYLNEESPRLDKMIGNGKRFMSYEIIDRLIKKKDFKTLETLSNGVSLKEALKGKKHEVFEPSFEIKYCFNEEIIEQKLNYIHLNPVRGKWMLTGNWKEFKHSSAGFYFDIGNKNINVTHYKSAGIFD
jgi:REP element-mobilizing transposase RayT